MQNPDCVPRWWPVTTQNAWILNSNRLFARKEQTTMIEVARVTVSEPRVARIRNEEKLKDYLESLPKSNDCLPAPPIAQFYCLRPFYTWSRLEISEACMSRILSHHQVFPEFFKYLQAFGQKTFARDEGFSGYDIVFTRNTKNKLTSTESCYMLKYVELHEDSEPSINPWAIRQALIYQKYFHQSRESSHVFVRLSSAMQLALKGVLQKSSNQDDFISRWESVHQLFLGTLNANWRDFINYLDHEVSIIFDQVILSKFDLDASQTIKEKSLVESSLANVKRLHYLIDRTARACHMLDLNSTVMKTMMKCHEDSSDTESSFRKEIYAVLEECQVLHKAAGSLLVRATSISQHLRDVIAMRNNEFIKTMTLSATQANGAILGLSQQAVSEAQSMKAITVVALIYVPASFVADFLQMGYVSTAQQNGLVVSATKGLWVYAIITVPLVILTMGIYFCFELVNRRLRSRKKSSASEMAINKV